jgi:hypothetical protein
MYKMGLVLMVVGSIIGIFVLVNLFTQDVYIIESLRIKQYSRDLTKVTVFTGCGLIFFGVGWILLNIANHKKNSNVD